MKKIIITLTLTALVGTSFGQSFDMSLSFFGINDVTGRYEVALLATPNFTETNGNSESIGAVVSLSNNIFLDPNGFVNDCTNSGPPSFVTTCEYPIEREEWDASFLSGPSTASGDRFVYQLLRTETGESTFFDAEDGVPVVLAVFQIYNTESGLPSSGDIILVDNDDPILDGTFNASFLQISYEITTGDTTIDLYNQHNPGANQVSFETLGTPDRIVDSTIDIYPNPFTDTLHIKSDLEIESIELFDVTGKRVFYEKATKALSLGHLQQGIYMLTVGTASGKETIKVVKDR